MKYICSHIVILFLSLTIVSCSLSTNNKLSQKDSLVFLPDSLPSGKVGKQYEANIKIKNNNTPVSWFKLLEGSIPTGLSLNECGIEEHPCEEDFKLIGVPKQSGTFEFKIGVSCFGTNVSGQSGNKTYTLVIREDDNRAQISRSEDVIESDTYEHLTCPEHLTVQDIAEMLIELEISGIGAYEAEDSPCLEQANFPYLRVIQNISEPYDIYIVKELLDIGKVETINETTGIYAVSFAVKAYPYFSDTKEISIYNEKIQFMLHRSERVNKSRGCAGILEPSKKVYIKEDCL